MRTVANEPLARHALAFVLAGGRGSRLLELTDRRAKPAVYFGGKSRIIDFALSNALNSGIRRIAVATQYKAHSLIRHLQMGWNFFRPERNESFDILPASQRVSETHVVCRDGGRGLSEHRHHRGLRRQIHRAARRRPRLQDGLRGDAAAACRAARPTSRSAASKCRARNPARFGIIHVDENDVIQSFLEKPADPPPMPGKPDISLASMGIYVFDTNFLFDELQARRRAIRIPTTISARTSSPISSRTAAPSRISSAAPACAPATISRSYWRDVGTVDAYWSANIDLTDVVPELDLYDRSWPIWTYAEITPPAKFVHDEDGRRGEAVTSLVSGGCIVSGASLAPLAAVHRRAPAFACQGGERRDPALCRCRRGMRA